MKAKFYIVLIGLLLCVTVHGQVKIGDNPQNIHPSSVLELESTTRALVVTRITTAQMNAMVPLQGAVVYNTDNQCLHYYSGTAWINLCEALEDGKTFSANAVTNPIPTIIITETGNNVNFEVGQITGNNIVNGSIKGAVDIQAGSVTREILAFASVNRDILEDNSVSVAEIDLDQVTLNTFFNDAGFITGETQNLSEVLNQGNAANNSITNLTNPINPQDAATKFYVDNALAGPGIDNQQLTLETGNLLTLENGGSPINLTPFLDNTDNQNITIFQEEVPQ